jgi:ectoine hydroxylase-related dioxygenase (phytanoyl-CoA dioxygenase family)
VVEAMISVDCKQDANWLTQTLEGLRHAGAAIVRNVLTPAFVEKTRASMYEVQKVYQHELGAQRLARAGELGVLRLPMKYDATFFEFLALPELLTILDHTVSETAIMHLQNGFILPSSPKLETPRVFQNRFHMDFPRVLNGYLASVNMFFAIDVFSAENGGTLIVPGTHQRIQPPSPEYLEATAVPVECPAGSMLVFDSTLWHAAGLNVSGTDRLAINHQFTRSYIKQQIDYVRALGEATILAQPPRTQQLLGWHTRVVTSLDEYYRPEHERLYRKGQG